jgi:hypothetical protein
MLGILQMVSGNLDDALVEHILQYPSEPLKEENHPTNISIGEEFLEDLQNLHRADLEERIKKVPFLPEPRDKYIRELLLSCKWLSNEHHGEVFTRVASYISTEFRKQLAKELIEMGKPSIGAKSLLASLEPEPIRTELYDSLIKDLGLLSDSYDREAATLAIVRTCTIPVVRSALLSIQRIDDIQEQAGAIFILAPYLSKADLSIYLQDERWSGKQISILTRMVSQLSSALKGGVLDAFVKEAACFSSEWWIVEALTLTILRLNEKEDLGVVLKAIKNISASDLQARIIGRIALRLARLGFTAESIRAADEAPLLMDKWCILADLSAQLAADGLITESEEIALTISDPEERSKAYAAISLHLAAQGQIGEAQEKALKISVEHWREWALSRLNLLKNTAEAIPVSKQRTVHSSTSGTTDSNYLDFEAICDTVGEMLKQGAECKELYRVLEAARKNDIEEVRKMARKFWQVRIQGEKTYLEMISEKPRALFLKQLQKLSQLLVLSAEEAELDEIASAINDVSSWWP